MFTLAMGGSLEFISPKSKAENSCSSSVTLGISRQLQLDPTVFCSFIKHFLFGSEGKHH